MILTSTLPAVTVAYCLSVTPIDWFWVCISVLASGFSANYWVYPVKGVRLNLDVSMSIVCVVSAFASGLALSGWLQIVLFGFGLFLFQMSSYAWRLPYQNSNNGPKFKPQRSANALTPYWSYFHAVFHIAMLFSVNKLVQHRSTTHSYEAYTFSFIALFFVWVVLMNFVPSSFIEDMLVDTWKSKNNNFPGNAS